MIRKHPEVTPADFPLLFAIDKFSFVIVAKQDSSIEGTVLEVLEPEPIAPTIDWRGFKIPRVSDIVPNEQDLMEAGPSSRYTPPPRPYTPTDEDPALIESVSNFWRDLLISPCNSTVDTCEWSSDLTVMEFEAQASSNIGDEWIVLDSWPVGF
jgi:hypothetical protein